jgi:uncharacterized protein (TIGR02246 family)
MLRAAVLSASFVLAAAAPAFAQSKAVLQKDADAWAAAYNKGDAKAVAALYTADADVLPDHGDLAHGRAAIEAMVKKMVESGTYQNDLKVTVQGVRSLGPNTASEIGTYSITPKNQPSQPEVGKFASVVRKVGSKWLLQTDIWNTNK